MNLLAELFKNLRIPEDDSAKYIEELKKLGYDDVQGININL